jgi:soluble lytic murein transglycosylase-like protein
MITAQALALCIFTAAQTYSVPPTVILGVLNVESGRVGMAQPNTNGTYDLGPMQINTIWVPELANYWRVPEKTALRWVRDDACINIGVGAWILRKKMNEAGSLAGGIAGYHSMTPSLGSTYRNKVLSAMRRYRLVRQPSDLVMGDNQSKRREPG